ncbi:MAG: aminotransferase class I/II-fold pyridoxal phosphate-dependent enzyme [Candidatus Margulisiibacteriota bacterium]
MNHNFVDQFSKYTPKNEPLTFWKGRVALYCFLRSLKLTDGDEVLLPGLTCVVVPNAIIYAGLVPIYIDIQQDSYNLDPDLIESKITSRTKVLIIQNTFGLSSNIEKITAIAKKYNLITIDDCTHGFGGTYNGKPNGSFTDAAFYSSQWNKPFSTVLGGYLIINNPQLKAAVVNEYQHYNQPTIIENLKLKWLFLIRKWVINRFTYWRLLYLYRWLSQRNLILGSSQKEELTQIIKPINYEKKMGAVQKKLASQQLINFDKKLLIRKEVAFNITEWLIKNEKSYVSETHINNHSFLKYPIRVKNRDQFFKLAEKHKIPLGDWFISPIHPICNHYEQWHFNEDSCPNAVKAAQELVNLPTDFTDKKKLINFLNKTTQFIL